MSTCSYIQMSDSSRERSPTSSPKQPATRRTSTRAAAKRAGAALMSAAAVAALADTFRVLGDPTRVRILDALRGGELCVCDIAVARRHQRVGGVAPAAPAARHAAGAAAPRRPARLLRARRSAHHRAAAAGAARTWRSNRAWLMLHRLRAARRVDLQDRGHGLPRGSRHPRAPAEDADRARGARRRRRRPAAADQVRRREADDLPHRRSGGADRHARLARARRAAAGRRHRSGASGWWSCPAGASLALGLALQFCRARRPLVVAASLCRGDCPRRHADGAPRRGRRSSRAASTSTC